MHNNTGVIWQHGVENVTNVNDLKDNVSNKVGRV